MLRSAHSSLVTASLVAALLALVGGAAWRHTRGRRVGGDLDTPDDAPFFVATVWACSVNYYRAHRRAHLDPRWAREHLPWHYDHHMGRNQNANWCVTHPFFDNLMGTRREFLGVQPSAPDAAGVPVEARERAAATSPGLC